MKLSSIAFIYLFFMTSSYAQIYQSYKVIYGNPLAIRVHETLSMVNEQRMKNRLLSSKVQELRSNYFNAMIEDKEDVKVHEKKYYTIMSDVDLSLLHYYVTSKEYSQGQSNDMWETVFGEIDGGIRSFCYLAFEKWADKYINEYAGLKQDNYTNDIVERTRKALELSEAEHQAYMFSRDILHFTYYDKKAKAKVNRKLYAMALLLRETSFCENVKDCELFYESLSKITGGQELEKIFNKVLVNSGLINNRIKITNPAEFKSDCNSTHFYPLLFESIMRINSESFVWFDVLRKKCQYDFTMANKHISAAKYVFDPLSYNSFIKRIYDTPRNHERNKNSGFVVFSEPALSIGDERAYNPASAYFMNISKLSNEKYFKYLLLVYSDSVSTENIDSKIDEFYKKYGKDDVLNLIEEKKEYHCRNNINDHLNYLILNLDDSKINLSSDNYVRLNDSGWGLSGCTKYTENLEEEELPRDTLVVYIGMQKKIKIDPTQWKGQRSGYHVNGLGNAICDLYDDKNVPGVIRVKFIYDGDLEFEYHIDATTNCKIVYYKDNDVNKEFDISNSIWDRKYKPCYFN